MCDVGVSKICYVGIFLAGDREGLVVVGNSGFLVGKQKNSQLSKNCGRADGVSALRTKLKIWTVLSLAEKKDLNDDVFSFEKNENKGLIGYLGAF